MKMKQPITTNPRDGKPFLGYDDKTESKQFLCYYDKEHGVFYNEYDCEMNPTHWADEQCKP
tara:strand:+ start:690 stop:872 length:183 start_codon:yes stop_codon:yes gene_type:complete